MSACGLLRVTVSMANAGRSTVTAQGELDLASAELLAGVLNAELQRGHRFVRLDLAGVGFADCAGLRAIVSAHNAFLAEGGALELSGVGTRVGLLLRMTSLDEALFFSTDDRADRLRPQRPRHLFAVPTS